MEPEQPAIAAREPVKSLDDIDIDYPAGARPPSTGEIGALALSLRDLYKCSAGHALTAAIMIDQGSATDALSLLSRVVADRAEALELRRSRAVERKGLMQ